MFDKKTCGYLEILTKKIMRYRNNKDNLFKWWYVKIVKSRKDEREKCWKLRLKCQNAILKWHKDDAEMVKQHLKNTKMLELEYVERSKRYSVS